ncbi:hypothetical protein HGRIS_009370 [Hohenbuehelia grisea]|uniref:Uncharacterized protein n=1 Tax=Hohenbuehelia grisea TaxID=104357 RepID=A0ABR3J1C9_9AGAR
MPTANTSVLPKGHTYLNPKIFITTMGKETFIKLLDKANDRDPDTHKMYIYNDYYYFACLDIVETTLTRIHTKLISRKNLDEAYSLMEALTVFTDFGHPWPMCNDGEQVNLVNKAYGALLVTLLRHIKRQGRLDVTHYPSLETLLKLAADWGNQMCRQNCHSNYDKVCKAIGKRLFANKSADDIALEKARFEEWKSSLEEEEAKDLEEVEKEEAEDDEEEEEEDDEQEEAGQKKRQEAEKPWFHDIGSYDEDTKDSDFTLTRIWKELKAYLKESPNGPMRGAYVWDLSDWTYEEKKPFLFSTMDAAL